MLADFISYIFLYSRLVLFFVYTLVLVHLFLFLFTFFTDGSMLASCSPNQSQLSLPGLIAFSANETLANNACGGGGSGNGGGGGGNGSGIGGGGATTALNVTSAGVSTTNGNKNRSHSTTSLYNQYPNGKRLMRERKTVCSLHPLSSTSNESYSLVDTLNCSGHTATDSDSLQQQQQQLQRDRDDSENEALSCSLPGSAVDSRRGSGLSTRCD